MFGKLESAFGATSAKAGQETTMSTTMSAASTKRAASPASAGDAVYALGLVGALVYFWQRADSPGGHLLAIPKAVVWPAFLVYRAFRRLPD